MVDQQKVEGLIHKLRTSIGYLEDIAPAERESFLADPKQIGAAKYYLQISIGACLDSGTHIASSERYRTPQNYRDVFSVLNENGILSDDFTTTLKQMAGLRNRLVHLYWDVDDEQIYSYLQNNLDDFDKYAQHILDFLKQ